VRFPYDRLRFNPAPTICLITLPRAPAAGVRRQPGSVAVLVRQPKARRSSVLLFMQCISFRAGRATRAAGGWASPRNRCLHQFYWWLRGSSHSARAKLVNLNLNLNLRRRTAGVAAG